MTDNDVVERQAKRQRLEHGSQGLSGMDGDAQFPTFTFNNIMDFSADCLVQDLTSCANNFSHPQPQLVEQLVDELIGNAELGENENLLNNILDSGITLAIDQPNTITNHNTEIVCFGMIPNIPATYDMKGGGDLAETFPVHIDSASCFSSDEVKSFSGRIHPDHVQLIECLLEETAIKLYATCLPEKVAVTKKRNRTTVMSLCTLDIRIYGPIELFDDLNVWFKESEEYFLQDPSTCDMNVRYCNPQRLSCDDLYGCVSLAEIVERSSIIMPKEIPEMPDFLDILSSHIDLDEAAQPSSIQAALKSHQKQALTFMINREKGWGFNIDKHDVWDIVDSGSRRMFFNTISQEYQPDAPPPFYGGIIADPMGLGKTLTMIALVASDLDSNPLPSESEYPTVDMPDASATLIIVPPPLIPSWEEQLLEHVVPGELGFHRHHGKTRLNDISEISQFNIVLTTYHTVSAEWKAANGGLEKSPLFSVRWRRIILDEAHFIRNGSSRMARAVCALDSIARWAVTGTPIQNRLGDLASLLKFIQAHPFNDPKRFETDVSRLWKSGSDGEAVNRLKRLSAHILLRRAKATINLPPRRDLVQAVEFTAEERATYKQLKEHAILNIDEALGNDSLSSKRHSYVNILQQIESMRLFSNLGFHYLSRHEKPSYQFSENEWSKVAQRTFNSQREMSSLSCKKCLSTVGLSDILLGEPTAGGESAIFTSCLKFFCKECLEKSISKGSSLTCGHTPPCQAAPVSTSSAALEEIDSFVPPTIQNLSNNLSSKVTALIDDIKSLPKDVKCIVFSTWRLTLDLITSGLNAASIQSIRFDGKVAQKDRHTVLKKFRSDPSIQVMLLTLSCGAVGLNLTVASRAYLVEPHWNPTLEEQALARIHRLGQTKEVTTVRFYVKNSFEEEVMQMQESKRQLAGVFLSPHDGGDADSSVSALKRLRDLL